MLGRNPGPDVDNVLIAAAAKTRLPAVFDQIMRRPESTIAVLDALEAGRVTLAQLGPGNVARLRTHPNRKMAERAATLIDRLTPNARERAEALAALAPEVEKPGDAAKGKMLFTGACATCHKFGDLGKDVGPPLNGIGVHARSELLNHIIDPEPRSRSVVLAVERHHEEGRDTGRRDRRRRTPPASRCAARQATSRSRKRTSPCARTPAAR